MTTRRPIEPPARPPEDSIDGIADWLIEQALGDPDLDAMFATCCERLCAAGIPLWRTHIAFRTLHPLFEAVATCSAATALSR